MFFRIEKGVCLLIILLIFSLGMLGCLKDKSSEKTKFRVAIVSIVEIEPIVELRKGFREVFENSDFAKKHEVIINEFNAQNDSSLINQIVDKLSTEKPNLIYALGTPIAQAIQKRIPDVLLVQGAVTDPVAAGLAKSWQGSGRNYVATTDLPPISIQVKLIKELTPSVKKLGVIYNPGEVNSVAVISRLRQYIKENVIDLRMVERPISNTSEVARAIQSLWGNADAIYLPPDNTAHAAIAVIGKFSREKKLPFYTTVSSGLGEGALATLSLDFITLGQESAKLALRVLSGEDPGKIPILPNENPIISINGKLAKEYSINIDAFKNRPNVKIVE